MATITRGATTLTPNLILGRALTREGRSIAHPILGTAETDVTARPAGPRSGDVSTVWASETDANAAAAALALPGGPWTFAAPGVGSLVAYVVGDVSIEALTDAGTTWQVTVGVLEVAP